jgi:MFS family permease
MTVGLVAASFVTKIWQLYLTQGILVGAGVGLLYIPSTAIPSQWFDKKLSLANAITAAGSGAGGLIVSSSTQPMIDHLSLAWSLRIIGIMAGVMNLLATTFLRNRDKIIRPPMHAFDTKLLRRGPVILFLAWSFFSMLGYIALLFSMSDFARSIGLDPSKAALVTAFLNLGKMLGRPFIGVLSDRFGRFEVAGCMTVACSVAVWALWVPAQSYAMAIIVALVIGAVAGVFWAVSTPSTSL